MGYVGCLDLVDLVVVIIAVIDVVDPPEGAVEVVVGAGTVVVVVAGEPPSPASGPEPDWSPDPFAEAVTAPAANASPTTSKVSSVRCPAIEMAGTEMTATSAAIRPYSTIELPRSDLLRIFIREVISSSSGISPGRTMVRTNQSAVGPSAHEEKTS